MKHSTFTNEEQKKILDALLRDEARVIREAGIPFGEDENEEALTEKQKTELYLIRRIINKFF